MTNRDLDGLDIRLGEAQQGRSAGRSAGRCQLHPHDRPGSGRDAPDTLRCCHA